MKKKTFIIILIVTLATIFLVGCVKDLHNDKKGNDMQNPKVVINMLDGKKIRIELLPEYAPKTVENFLKLVDEDYYDNVVFHRIIDDFMIQTGWIDMSQQNTPVYKPEKDEIIGEFSKNGFTQNTLSHTPGIVSMARLGGDSEEAMNSGSTQFFICTADATHLDGIHAAFGRLMDNESMVNAIDISHIPTGYFYGKADFPIMSEISHAIISSIERLE